MKLADKTANLRGHRQHAAADWSLERRREYFDWAAEVVDRLQGSHPRLESLFDNAHASGSHVD